MDTLRLRLLGPPEITLDERPVKGFVSAKVQALLYHLAVSGRPQTRDALVGLLWAEMPESDARTSLRQALSNLRRILGPYLLISRETVAFNRAAPYWLDVAEFERAMAGTDALSEAITLYHGDFLDGFFVRDAPTFDEWAAGQRARLRESALRAFDALAAQQMACGDLPGAIEAATRLLALDPWREDAHRQLMHLLALTGRHAAALKQFETCRDLLMREIGVAPAPETRALAERIRAALAAPPPPLPVQPTPFIGRETELRAIAPLLAAPDCRLLTVSGPGGAGKTRFALQAASSAAPAFLNGAWFVPLAPVSTPERLPAAILEALRVTPDRRADPRHQLLDHLRERELLLVLDNCEHLLGGAPLIAEILRETRDIKLLATSRERLGIYGETVVPLGGLGYPGSEAASEPGDRSAMALFLAGARRANARFEPTAEDERSIARICRLVDGLPLGIELAAAWVSTLDCAAIADAIERDIDLLTTNQVGTVWRQHSLRAAFDHSWALMTADERRALAALSVCRGGFDAEAAAAVTSLPARATLTTLLDKSLLRRASDGRYDMHEAVRPFAQEKLARMPDEAERAADRHSAYYGRFVARQAGRLHGAQAAETLAAIERELPNVRAAWAHAIARRQWLLLDVALEGLAEYHDMRSRFRDSDALLGDAADALRADDADSLLYGRLLGRRSRTRHRLNDLPAAARLAQASLELCERHAARRDAAYARSSLGLIAFSAGDYRTARTHLAAALAMQADGDPPWERARALNNVGIVVNAEGDLAEARRLFTESIAIKRMIDDLDGVATTLNNLGIAASTAGDFDEAIRCRTEALAIHRALGNRLGQAHALNNLGYVRRMQGDFAGAQPLLRECLAISEAIGSREMAAFAHSNLGAAACGLGDFAGAADHLRTTLVSAVEVEATALALTAVVETGRLCAQTGEATPALELLMVALRQPALTRELRDTALQLCAALVAQLPEAQAAEAQARGEQMNLDEAIALAMRALAARRLRRTA